MALIKHINHNNIINKKFVDNLFDKFINQCIKHNVRNIVLVTVLFDLLLDKYNVIDKKIIFGYVYIDAEIKCFSEHIWNSYNKYDYNCFHQIQKINLKNYNKYNIYYSKKKLPNYIYSPPINMPDYYDYERIINIYLNDKNNFCNYFSDKYLKISDIDNKKFFKHIYNKLLQI